MFSLSKRRNPLAEALRMAELIFHWTVRDIGSGHRSPVVAALMSTTQMLIMLSIFFLMFAVLGMRGAAVRGDFVLYLMTGIFCFMTHGTSVSAVAGSDGPTSPMMMHAPMNTTVAIVSKALSTLYMQFLTMFMILFSYDALTDNVEIYDWVRSCWFFILSWASGCAIGLVLLGLRPFMPTASGIISTLYTRANMVFSGKMFLANSMPAYLLPMFSWNPLFHIIDQLRGAVFLNYHPHFTSATYPVILTLVFAVIGMMGEFYARKHASASKT